MIEATTVGDWIAAMFILGGALLSLLAGIGLIRFPDALSRLHTAAKPQVLGLLLILVGAGIRLGDWSDAATLVVIAVFQLATAPTAAHMIARATYRYVKPDPDQLVVDEYAERTN